MTVENHTEVRTRDNCGPLEGLVARAPRKLQRAVARLPLVAELKRKRGLAFDIVMIELDGYGGLGVRIARYSLAPESVDRARQLIAVSA